MTLQSELSLLETAYTSLLTNNVKAYTINGRSITKNDLEWVTKRMDALRAAIYRQTNGGGMAAAMRPSE